MDNGSRWGLFLEIPSCIEKVFQQKYWRYVQLCGPYNSKCQQTLVFGIFSYTAEPVGDGKKRFLWDFYSGAPKYLGKLEMVRGNLTKFNFVVLCNQPFC